MDLDELRQRVGTIVVVMMENRSFDHMLGHMSLADYGGAAGIDGVRSLGDPRFANPSANGTLIGPFIAADGPLPNDLPHERGEVATQLAHSPVPGGFAMNGFVKAYETATGTTGVLRPPPMGLLTPRDVPMTRFLADEYAPCDRWFAPLPTSTQPNRLMALSGYTLTDTTRSGLLPDQHTVLDWLEQRHIRWRVYSAGLSFFMLMKGMWPLLLTDHFRRLSDLSHDAQHEPDDQWPQVIFVEPDYDDSPVHLSGHACDNHPPVPVAFGEAFLRQVYEALTAPAAACPGRWRRTVMVVTYDEHGGFFDHVPPPPVPCPPPPGATYTKPFESTGVRVPAIVVSPMVARGVAKHAVADNTSILQLIAQRFGSPGEIYSPEVEARRRAGIESVAALLDSGVDRASVAPHPAGAFVATASLQTTRPPATASQQAFASAIAAFAQASGPPSLAKYPEIAHWNGR